MQALINLFTVKNEISLLLLIDLTNDNYPRVLDKGNLSSDIWTLPACAWNIEASVETLSIEWHLGCNFRRRHHYLPGAPSSTVQSPGAFLMISLTTNPSTRQVNLRMKKKPWDSRLQTHQNSSPNLHLDMTSSPSNQNKWCTLRIFSAGSQVRWQ